jgi:hypothetical protein
MLKAARALAGFGGQAGTVDAVVRALEAKGVVIKNDGVRLRKPRR